jgi:hypothetical protein
MGWLLDLEPRTARSSLGARAPKPIAVIIRLAADYGVITESISFTYSSMARCSSLVTPAATASASDFIRHATFPCQQ